MRVWMMFVSMLKTSQPNNKGSGIGLSLSRQIMCAYTLKNAAATSFTPSASKALILDVRLDDRAKNYHKKLPIFAQ